MTGKRARTRAHVASTAARLFAERGYENTAVAEVARAAGVSEQTVYNHFPAKRDLVLDQDDEVRERFVAAVQDRPADTSPARALEPVVRAMADRVRSMSPEELRGSVGSLAASSPAVRRLALESTDRLADELAGVLARSDGSHCGAVVRLEAVGLAWLSQTLMDESARMVRAGLTPDEIARGLHARLDAVLDRLDAWWPSGSG